MSAQARTLADYPTGTTADLWAVLRRAEDDAKVYVKLGDQYYGLDLRAVIEAAVFPDADPADADAPVWPTVTALFLSLYPERIPHAAFDEEDASSD